MTFEFPDFRKFAQAVTAQLGKSATLLPPAEEIAKLGPDMDVETAERVLPMLCECEIADDLKVLLMLPQELQLYWQDGKAMGEMFLGNTSGIDSRLVDPSQHALEFFGAPLSDYRIIDEVSVVGGPFFTLVRRDGNRLAERLYFFDTRKCWKMDISIADYVNFALKSFAPLYWQCLFIEDALNPKRAEILADSLKYLATRADPSVVEMLEEKLQARK
jgi:hypothetical protein